MQVERTGTLVNRQTLVTGGALVIVVRILELALMHHLLDGIMWTWPNFIAFLSEYEVQGALGTVVVWAGGVWRASMIPEVLDAAVAERLERVLELRKRQQEVPQVGGGSTSTHTIL